MDVILIFNGLGNQMSQYAFYLKKKQISRSARFQFLKKSKDIHNGYELDKVFGIKQHESFVNTLLYSFYLLLAYKRLPFISQPMVGMLRRMGFAIYNEDDNYNFQADLLPASSGIKYYAGGWHSEKYFAGVEDKVLESFQFDEDRIGETNQEVLKKIRSCTSISVHIRRGDFLDSVNYNKFGSVCTLNYYLTAIRKMRSLVGNPHFFLFTNDPSWVSNHFTDNDFTLIDINSAGDSWKDMFLISNCKHNICSNGSFSWWSSYLNKNEHKIVIVPKNFVANTYFEDIYPENWVQLSDY
jgi:hypothetical protein